MNLEDRLIVALDVPDIPAARALVRQLDGTVSFFKIGYWLFFQPDVNALIDELLAAGKQVFLDYKIYDIGETVRRGVAGAARRGISILTVHGDPEILRAAAEGRDGSSLKIFAVTVLTSLDDAAIAAMGYAMPVRDLVSLRVQAAIDAGCDGIIAASTDYPDRLRAAHNAPNLLVATPGIRPAGTASADHKRPGTPEDAIAAGADYLVVGRPIIHAPNPQASARSILAAMREGEGRRSLTTDRSLA